MSNERLNEKFRAIPIEIAGNPDHVVTIDVGINVCVDLPPDDSFGSDFLDNFDLRQFPSPEELDDWLASFAKGKYNHLSEKARKDLLDRSQRIIHILVEAAIKATIKMLGLEMIEVSVPPPSNQSEIQSV